jgi:hypothetical protein
MAFVLKLGTSGVLAALVYGQVTTVGAAAAATAAAPSVGEQAFSRPDTGLVIAFVPIHLSVCCSDSDSEFTMLAAANIIFTTQTIDPIDWDTPR